MSRALGEVRAVAGIRLEVVTPSGAGLVDDGLDEVVFRRREGPEAGSLISILPRHGSLLCQAAAGEITWRLGDVSRHARVGPAIIEVLDDRVLVLASELERG